MSFEDINIKVLIRFCHFLNIRNSMYWIHKKYLDDYTHVWLLNSFIISKKSLYTWGWVLNLYLTWSRYDNASSTFNRWNCAPAGGWAPDGPAPEGPTPDGPTPTVGGGIGAGAGDWRPKAAGRDPRFGCWGGNACCVMIVLLEQIESSQNVLIKIAYFLLASIYQ